MTEPHFPETTFNVSEDGKLATIQIGAEKIVADVASLENFIGHLGMLRSRLSPQVPLELTPESRYLQLDFPAMTIADSNDLKSVGILIRTPGYGWIACGIPVDQAVAMGRHLVNTFASRVAPPAASND